MRHGFLALVLAGAAAGALCWTGAGAHSMRNSAGTAAHVGNFHRRGPVLWPFGFRGPHLRFVPARGFRRADIAAIGDVAIGDADTMYFDDEGGDLADMHFRVEEPFGPWDVGMRPPPPDCASCPWEDARMDPGQGFEPEE